MPLTEPAPRTLVAGVLGALLLARAATATAEEHRCVRGAPVRIDVAPSEADPALARRVMEQMFSEVSPPEDKDCVGDGANATAPASTLHVAATVTVSWLAPLKAHIALELKTDKKPYAAARDVDLEPIDDEGRPLALGIAAAEMLEALTERAEADAVEKPVLAAPPPSVVVHIDDPVPVAPTPRATMGSLLAVEHYTAGLTLIGPDLRASAPVSSHVEIGARVGIRSPSLTLVEASELRLAPVYVTGLGAQVGSDQSSPRGFAAKAAVDAVWVSSTQPGSKKEVGVVARVGMGAWETLAPRVKFVVEGSVGLPLKDVDLIGNSGESHTVVGGAVFGFGVGIVVSF